MLKKLSYFVGASAPKIGKYFRFFFLLSTPCLAIYWTWLLFTATLSVDSSMVITSIFLWTVAVLVIWYQIWQKKREAKVDYEAWAIWLYIILFAAIIRFVYYFDYSNFLKY